MYNTYGHVQLLWTQYPKPILLEGRKIPTYYVHKYMDIPNIPHTKL
jgi:hypothetical protein